MSECCRSISEKDTVSCFTYFTKYVSNTVCKVANWALGNIFRYLIYNPLSHSSATLQTCKDLLDTSVFIDKSFRKEVLNTFSIEKKSVEVQMGDRILRLNIKIYEAESQGTFSIHNCIRVGGKSEGNSEISNPSVYSFMKAYVKNTLDLKEKKGFRIIQFPLYGHETKTTKNSSWQPWQPRKAKEVSNLFFLFLEKIKSSYPIHSIMCHSLGSIVFEQINPKENHLPPLIIFDRALPSLLDAIKKLYGPIIAYIFYAGAYLTGWAPNPEKRLVHFVSASEISDINELSLKKVVVLEVKEDHYFPRGAFSSLKTQKISIDHYLFDLSDATYHKRSHHGSSLSKLKDGTVRDPKSILPLRPYENAAWGIVKYLILEQKKTESC